MGAKNEDEANSNFRAFSHPLLDNRIYIFLKKKDTINYFFRSTITRAVFLSVFNKSLTYIHNIHTLHRGIIVEENMVQPVLFTHQTILQG